MKIQNQQSSSQGKLVKLNNFLRNQFLRLLDSVAIWAARSPALTVTFEVLKLLQGVAGFV